VIKDGRVVIATSSPLLIVGRSEIGRNAFSIVRSAFPGFRSVTMLAVFHWRGVCYSSSEVLYSHKTWSQTTGYNSLYTRKLISSRPSALSGLLLKIALSTLFFVRSGYLMLRPALLLTARSGSRPSGSGGVGKRVSIRTSAFFSSVI
jgi:hypothetical protein